MKGLILKDMLVFRNQRMSIWLVLLALVWLALGNGDIGVVMIAGTIYTRASLAYDEQCKWDQLAGALPYTVPQLVLSKYALGLIATLGAAALAVAAWAVSALLGAEQRSYERLIYIAASLPASLLLQGITLPITLHFGAEHGWIVGLVVTALVLMLLVLIIMNMADVEAKPIIACALALISTALYLLSIPLSLRAYRPRHRA